MNLGLLANLFPHLKGWSMVEDNDTIIHKEIKVRGVRHCPNGTNKLLFALCFFLFSLITKCS